MSKRRRQQTEVPPAVPPEVLKLFSKQSRPEYLSEDGFFVGRPQISKVFKGRRFVAVASRISTIPPEMSFHEFIEAFLGDVIGHDWISAEQAKTVETRHPIIQWQSALAALRMRQPDAIRGAIREIGPTGSALAFLPSLSSAI